MKQICKKILAFGVALNLLFASPALAANQASTVMPLVGPHSATDLMTNFLNPALQALFTCNWGPSAPLNGPSSAAGLYECWANTTANPVVFNHWDGTSWVPFGQLNTSTHVWFEVGPSIGVISGSSAASGIVGEVLSIAINQAGAVTGFVTATAKTITSLSLTAGDWTVSGVICANPAGTTTVSQVAGGLSTTTNTFTTALTSGAAGVFQLNLTFTTGAVQCVPVPDTQIILSSTTTIFLVGQFGFGTSTMGGFGSIYARRER